MRIRLDNEPLLAGALSLLLIILVLLVPATVARLIFALPLLLFLPGYVVASCLFPRKQSLDSYVRVALSFGLSLAIVPFLGLILNFTPFGVKLSSLAVTLALLVTAFSVLAWRRRLQLPAEERRSFSLELQFSPLAQWKLQDKVLLALAGLALLGGLATVGFMAAVPRKAETFTEFYLLGPGGQTQGYPMLLWGKLEAQVMVGIINREGKEQAYGVKLLLNGQEVQELGPLVLKDGERRDEVLRFKPLRVGDKQTAEYLLFREGETQPYRRLFSWMDVKPVQFIIQGLEPAAEAATIVLSTERPIVITVSVLNLGDEALPFRLVLQVEEEEPRQFGPVTLKLGEEWKQEISYRPSRVGSRLKADFLLYKGSEEEPTATKQVTFDALGTSFVMLWTRPAEPGKPVELKAGTEETVIVRVENFGSGSWPYRFEVWLGGERILESETFVLGRGEKEERYRRLPIAKVGEGQKLELFLFQGEDPQPFQSLQFTVNVRP